MTRMERVTDLARAIGKAIDDQPMADALLALLLVAEYNLERLLELDPPPDVKWIMKKLYDLIRLFAETGRRHMAGTQ